MGMDFNCSQVESLINLYIEGNLAPPLKENIEKHLSTCPKCRKKIEQLQNVLFKYAKKDYTYKENQDKQFIKNLSAYVDNELDTSENVKIKKITISNPSARQKLESMYNYQKLMHSAYEKTKNNSKFDYSKDVISIINGNTDYSTIYFRNLAIIIAFLIVAIISGFAYLYF